MAHGRTVASGTEPAVSDVSERGQYRRRGMTDELDALLAEQVAYYRARASEYDATTPVDGCSRNELLDALNAFGPSGAPAL
jgi:hypothetical protein